jgi:hypothetical protein
MEHWKTVMANRTSQPSGKYSFHILESQVQILAWRPDFLTQFGGFRQSKQPRIQNKQYKDINVKEKGQHLETVRVKTGLTNVLSKLQLNI